MILSKRLVIALSMLLLVLAPIASLTSAQTRVAGVSVGDSFKYSFKFDMNISNSQFDFQSLFEGLLNEVKNIDWVQLSVTQVSGAQVTVQTTMHFVNGTEQSQTSTVNVSTGQRADNDESSLATFLVASNLNVGDPVYIGGIGGTINETVSKTYPSGIRQLNHQNITTHYDVSAEELSSFNLTQPLQETNAQNVYWDKQSGSLIEMTYSMVARSPQVNADISLSVQLIDSNVFTVPEIPTSAVLISSLIILTATLMIVRIKPKLLPTHLRPNP